ncbi:MAG: T9SS type A sorting domain-containing protein [Sphingobacteriaceae bacterium]|nr:MAG: T9SS type A sorting domain-containing protein [Sphingobacteriaceae bacterium]
MKKVLLGILFTAMGSLAFGQLALPQGGISPRVPLNPSLKVTRPMATPQKFSKKDTVSASYNWAFAMVFNQGETSVFPTFQTYNNLTMFPDSTVKQAYSATEAGPVYMHSVGQVFDPKSAYFDNEELGTMMLSKYNKYTWDSVTVFYNGYDHLVENSVDTLIFQFYTSRTGDAGGIIDTYFGTKENPGENTAIVGFNHATNLGANAVGEYRYLMTEKDTIGPKSGVLGQITVPTKNGNLFGISVPANQIAGFTITYRPGFAYTAGDTLDQRFYNENSKKLNHFRPTILFDENKAAWESYNNGLRLTTATRYNQAKLSNGDDNGWRNWYIPGNAWTDNNQHLYSSFYITSNNVSIKETGAYKGYGIGNIYPNPASDVANLSFELPKTENVTINVYNAVGQKISTVANGNYAAGKHNVNFSVENLNSGVYFYTINAGGYAKTMKFTVVK